MDLWLTANLQVDEGSCTGFITGLLTSSVTPDKVDGHFNVGLLFLFSETRGILWVFLFLHDLKRLPQVTFLYKAS